MELRNNHYMTILGLEGNRTSQIAMEKWKISGRLEENGTHMGKLYIATESVVS